MIYEQQQSRADGLKLKTSAAKQSEIHRKCIKSLLVENKELAFRLTHASCSTGINNHLAVRFVSSVPFSTTNVKHS